MITFRIKGVVREKESGAALPGLFVKAYDKDLLFDDLMGSAVTDSYGKFEIISEPSDFRDFFEKRPDLYFKIFRDAALVHSTEDAVRWNMAHPTVVEIRIPFERVFPPDRASITFTGDDGQVRDTFDAGESLTIAARGLRPAAVYDIDLSSGGRGLFSSRLLTNARGDIEATVLWPQMGMDDPNSGARYSYAEARERWQGKSFDVAVRSGKQIVSKAQLRMAERFNRTLVMSTDRSGRLLNGFEAGREALYISAHNLPFTGDARVFLVPRRHDWRAGDSIEPALLADGRPAVRDFVVQGNDTLVEFAAADLLPGAYDFVIRPIRYGYEDDERMQILRTDIVGGRWTTGVVIREAFLLAKPVLGGCVNKIPVSGRTLLGSPYFQFADTFTIGEDIYAALDPGIIDPGNISKMCAFYVVASKNAAQWNASNSLQHLAVLGGNSAVQKIKVQSGCINANKVLVWPNAMDPGEYDIVVDFGNNTPDAMTFVPDNAYNTPLDVIDGYFVAGFRVIEDPGVFTEFGNAGSAPYDENDVNAMGLVGSVTVEDELTHYSTPGVFTSINTTVPLQANVFFPADLPGITDPSQISASKPDYPLIVIIHGNGHSFTSYDFLLEHFAKNGFIAASIHLNGGMSGLGRANVFFEHMTVLSTMFGSKMQNNIGIMGHSRGGEAVLKAARLNQQLGLGHNINAVISLAPTDQYGKEVLGGAWAKPFFVLYGSRDGDITGGIWTPGYTVPQTGFALYDRAGGMKKSMAFVYKASHNGFITTNDMWIPAETPTMIPETTQKAIAQAYMTAFFRWHLRNESKWEGMFKGEWKPASVELTGAEFYVQYQDTVNRTVDTFDGAHTPTSWQGSTIGGTVSHNSTLPADPSENELTVVDGKSPHDTGGLKLRWDNTTDRLEFSVPAGSQNVLGFEALSFRVSQVADSMNNPANQAQNLRVALKDAANNERAVRVSAFNTIPYPDVRTVVPAFTKSAMNTIRIPLKSYTIVCAGQVQVDLQNVLMVSFAFSEKTAGEIDIDNVEFTN